MQRSKHFTEPFGLIAVNYQINMLQTSSSFSPSHATHFKKCTLGAWRHRWQQLPLLRCMWQYVTQGRQSPQQAMVTPPHCPLSSPTAPCPLPWPHCPLSPPTATLPHIPCASGITSGRRQRWHLCATVTWHSPYIGHSDRAGPPGILKIKRW